MTHLLPIVLTYLLSGKFVHPTYMWRPSKCVEYTKPKMQSILFLPYLTHPPTHTHPKNKLVLSQAFPS